MIGNIILVAVVVVIAVAVVGLWYWRHRPRALKTEHFQKHWQELQVNLKNKETWPDVVMAADKLLDEALRKKRVAGKNMGERLVKAQRMLTDNDGVWFGHKLRGQLEHEPKKKLKESEVKEALIGIRQALKDLGALPESKIKSKTATPPVPSARPKEQMPTAKTAAPNAPKAPAKPAPRPTPTAKPKRTVRRRKI